MQSSRPLILVVILLAAVLAYTAMIGAWPFDRGGAFPSAGPKSAIAPGVPSAAAIGGAEALAGDRIRFGDRRFDLEGVQCPAPSTERGRNAKALANTFLRIPGEVTCRSRSFGGRMIGDCIAETSDGQRSLADVLRASGYCGP